MPYIDVDYDEYLYDSPNYSNINLNKLLGPETDPTLQVDPFLQCPQECNGHELVQFLDSFLTWYSHGKFYGHDSTGTMVKVRSIYEKDLGLDNEQYITVQGFWEGCLRVICKLGMWSNITRSEYGDQSCTFRLYFKAFLIEYPFKPKFQLIL